MIDVEQIKDLIRRMTPPCLAAESVTTFEDALAKRINDFTRELLSRIELIDDIPLCLDVPDWSHYRVQAAIAAMQGLLSRQTYQADLETLAKDSVKLANYLIEELKEEK